MYLNDSVSQTLTPSMMGHEAHMFVMLHIQHNDGYEAADVMVVSFILKHTLTFKHTILSQS